MEKDSDDDDDDSDEGSDAEDDAALGGSGDVKKSGKGAKG